jgi:hypothetical protein
MSAQLTSPQNLPSRPADDPATVSGDLHCALTGKLIHPDEAYWAPPLITTRELVTTLVQTMLSTPGAIGQVLMGEQPNVPYAPEARAELGRRRSVEQVKLLALLLVIATLLIVPIVLLAG